MNSTYLVGVPSSPPAATYWLEAGHFIYTKLTDIELVVLYTKCKPQPPQDLFVVIYRYVKSDLHMLALQHSHSSFFLKYPPPPPPPPPPLYGYSLFRV